MKEIDQYDYELPRELIAQDPVATRSDSRLMIVDRKSGQIDHAHVRDLGASIRAEDVLVLNNSRVIPAKMMGYRSKTGGRWQGLFLRSDPKTGIWEVLTKTRGTLEAEETLTLLDREGRDGMKLQVVARTDDGHLLVLPLMADSSETPLGEPGEWLDRYGRIPLPPYIRDGQMVDADVQNYQTVYAQERGSVAAPTAGLHFTDRLLDEIRKGQTEIAEVTLHVGIGTFRPIAVDQLSDHQMHEEWGRIDATASDQINDRRRGGGRCIAVGTTSVRVLESAAAANAGQLQPWTAATDLFIKPPYTFSVVDALMTNFHLPKSSLLVLVSAFAGKELIKHAYEVAIEEEYRFFSYGDAMLIV